MESMFEPLTSTLLLSAYLIPSVVFVFLEGRNLVAAWGYALQLESAFLVACGLALKTIIVPYESETYPCTADRATSSNHVSANFHRLGVLHENIGLHFVAALYRNHLGLADLCDTGIVRRCILVTDKVLNPGSLVPKFVLAFRRIGRLQVIFARVKSEKTILASVIGLHRTNGFQSPFPRKWTHLRLPVPLLSGSARRTPARLSPVHHLR